MVKVSSTMIETVQARQLGAFQFEGHYENLCALQDSVPLAAVKAHLSQGVVDLNGDRIRLNDWDPIINTIRINKSLQFLAVRSYYQVTGEEDEKRSAILRRKLPSIRSKEITHRLCKALKECLFVSPTLSCIELQGLALRDRDLQVLVKGISKSRTLRHLSLESCRIGDKGLETLCKGLKNGKNMNSVNLSGCSLSHRGAEDLAGVIKHQGMQRHNEAWRDSLRYRRPDLDRMAGLRRITINNNPMLGEDGARMLAEALKDDLWLKALDLQGCGISTTGAKTFLEVLKYNTTLVVLDLRRNPLVDRDVLHSLMEQLMLNSNGDDGEYKWMKTMDPDPSPAHRGKRRTTKVLNSNVGKKFTIKISPNRSRFKGKSSSVHMSPTKVDMTPSSTPGAPWRTAARANRFRGHPPENDRFEESGDFSSPSVQITTLATDIHGDGDGGSDEDEEETLNVMIEKDSAAKKMKRMAAEASNAMKQLEQTHLAIDLENKKEILIELEQMRRLLLQERLSHSKADQKAVSLMLENRRLKMEIEALKRTQRSSGGGMADDAHFLANIEDSFKQFHAFIDMLKEAGLGQLVTMAGLEQSSMPFANTYSSNKNGFGTTRNIVDNTPLYSKHPSFPPHTSYPSHQYNKTSNSGGGGISSTPAPRGHTNTIAQSSPPPFYTQYSLACPKNNSTTNSFAEESPILIGGGEGKYHPQIAPLSELDDSRDTARKEADEVYSRLLQDTHQSLAQPDSSHTVIGSPGGFTRSQPPAGNKNNDDDEDEDDIEEVEEIETNDEANNKGQSRDWEDANVSYENPSSFMSERGNDSQQEREEDDDISRDKEEPSDNDDF